jgi:antitoxin ParD1/3/4
LSKPIKKTITLYASDVKRIDRLVSSGFCLSARDASRKGMDALEARIEEWLRKEVLPVCQELEEHPERALPAEEVFASIRAHHDARMRQSAESDRSSR